MSVYQLKPAFQNLLRPLARRLAARGLTANQVTLLALAGSLMLGGLLLLAPARIPPLDAVGPRPLFLLLPLWLFLRMALNALDGMLAREHGQKSALGCYLNELADILSDAALYLPFALVPGFGTVSVALFVFLAALAETAGILGALAGASRRYDGPMGKSDRALVMGLLAIATAAGPPATFATLQPWVFPTLNLLLCLTIATRARRGAAEAESVPQP